MHIDVGCFYRLCSVTVTGVYKTVSTARLAVRRGDDGMQV